VWRVYTFLKTWDLGVAKNLNSKTKGSGRIRSERIGMGGSPQFEQPVFTRGNADANKEVFRTRGRAETAGLLGGLAKTAGISPSNQVLWGSRIGKPQRKSTLGIVKKEIHMRSGDCFLGE